MRCGCSGSTFKLVGMGEAKRVDAWTETPDTIPVAGSPNGRYPSYTDIGLTNADSSDFSLGLLDPPWTATTMLRVARPGLYWMDFLYSWDISSTGGQRFMKAMRSGNPSAGAGDDFDIHMALMDGDTLAGSEGGGVAGGIRDGYFEWQGLVPLAPPGPHYIHQFVETDATATINLVQASLWKVTA